MFDLLAGRRAERESLIELARDYIRRLSQVVAVEAAFVVGSVARGDFNLWSDVDVVVVAENLPSDSLERTGLLISVAPARVQPVGFTPAELERARRRRNPLVLEADALGISLADVLAGSGSGSS